MIVIGRGRRIEPLLPDRRRVEDGHAVLAVGRDRRLALPARRAQHDEARIRRGGERHEVVERDRRRAAEYERERGRRKRRIGSQRVGDRAGDRRHADRLSVVVRDVAVESAWSTARATGRSTDSVARPAAVVPARAQHDRGDRTPVRFVARRRRRRTRSIRASPRSRRSRRHARAASPLSSRSNSFIAAPARSRARPGALADHATWRDFTVPTRMRNDSAVCSSDRSR